MIQPQDKTSVTVPEPSHRSRWRRFSPSMGWRAFWSEILIVVLGVVIALAANEVVQNWNWRIKVKDAEARLQGDVAWAFLWSAERSAGQPCVDAQLATMARAVVESGETLQPFPVATALNVQRVVYMPNRGWRFPVWGALLADGTAPHFDASRQALFGHISDGLALSRESQAEERRLGGRLLLMRDSIVLDPGVRSSLLADINQMRSITAHESLIARQRMRLITDAGLAPPDATVERFMNASGEHPNGPDFSGMPRFCKSRSLPMADWREYRKLPAMNIAYPGAGGKKP